MARPYPTSIYRLQLTEEFTIKAATELLPHLHSLGVEGIYCSPYFAAHSTHGYDTLDPNRINPRLATWEEYDSFCTKAHELGLFHIADVVPNHMGVIGFNPWLWDVLEKGKESPYAHFFDIDWDLEKIEIPILGTSYEEALTSGALKIKEWQGRPVLTYGEAYFPLCPDSSASQLERQLEEQHYQLVHWRASAKRVSYRRFFNINELIGLRVEEKTVFDAYHELLFSLLSEGKIDGLRVDHPDGLYDPFEYLERVREKHKGFIALEKILGWEEELPIEWPVEGTVGYEYLSHLSGLFAKKGESLTKVYQDFTGKREEFADLLYEKKKLFIATEMEGDLDRLAKRLYGQVKEVDLPIGHIRDVIKELLTVFPVYRTYIQRRGPVSKRDRRYLTEAFAEARKRGRELEERGFRLLEQVLFLEIDTPPLRDWICQFQQMCAPIMAKGFEDIALYNGNRLLSLNEVGSTPARGGVDPDEFHKFCKQKQANWPLGILSVSTHDTKRSMDSRMHLSVISEQVEEWGKLLDELSRSLACYKTAIDGLDYPDRNGEIMIYQSILALFPCSPSFERLWVPILKSLKEAREFTSWRHPNSEYEAAAKQFVKEAMRSPLLEKFYHTIAPYGHKNILSATALHLASPGIVDLYEGCEQLRFSLMDPDNRRGIDFSNLVELLPLLDSYRSDWFQSPESGMAKLYLHKKGLTFRREHRDLFLKGSYTPLKVEGLARDHVIAFARSYGRETLIVVGARHLSQLKKWGNTSIELPFDNEEGRELFSDRLVPLHGRLKASDLLEAIPFAWVYLEV